MSLSSAEKAEEISQFIKKAGGNSTWDKLDEYLAQQKGEERFVINRTFNTSVETMFEMWTNPEHFSQWLPPSGSTMAFLKPDIRPGGTTFYAMTNGQTEMYGRIHYLEIHRPDFLKYTQEFCDKNGAPTRHPMAPTWPATMLTKVEFADEGYGRTRVTVTWEPHGSVTSEELEIFVKARTGMTGGWTGSFDKLEELLKARG